MLLRIRRILPVLGLALFANAALQALPSPSGADDKAFVLAGASYRVEGLALSSALDRFLGVVPGLRFEDEEAVRLFTEERERLLKNNRIFEPSASVRYELAGEPGRSPRPFTLVVEAKTTWAALALPFPKYSSDDGLSLAVRFKNYNFLGTLEPLGLTLDYFFKDGALEFGADFSVLPRILGADWSLAISGDSGYGGGEFTEPNFSASAGATYRFTGFGLPWSASPSFSYLYERDYKRHTAKAGFGLGFGFSALLDWTLGFSESYGYVFTYPGTETQSLSHSLSLGTSLPLVRLPFFGALTLAASSGPFLTTAIPDFNASDAGWSAYAGLSFGRVDWSGNFRRGASLALGASYAYHFIAPLPSDLHDLTLNLDTLFFASLGNLIGLNARTTARWFGTWTLLGERYTGFVWEDYLRGRRDAVDGDLGVVLNLELPINVAQGSFFGAGLLEAEVFFNPFLDLGYVRRDPATPLGAEADRIFCGGFEVIVFPERARAFQYRGSVGYDLGDYLQTRDFETSKLEITLGLGIFF